jgi:hypothetical protein
MRAKLQKSKEDSRVAIEKEIAAITTDLERLRAIIHRATNDQPEPAVPASPPNGHRSDMMVS